MANATAAVGSPAPRKRRRWLRILGWVFGILIVLLVVVYFVATSSAFLKGAILPRVSKAINADVTISDASISPFSQVVLHNLKVQSANRAPLVTAPEVTLRYSLMDILHGNIHVDEITLVSPSVTLVTSPDGSNNLDPILQSQKAAPKPEKAPAPAAKPSKPLQIDIRKITLTDATLRNVKNYPGDRSDIQDITHLNVNLTGLKNGQTGKLTVAADINVQNNPPAPGTNALLQAKLTGDFSLGLSADLKPANIEGSTRLEVARAEGALAQAAGFAGSLDCSVTPTEIKQVALKFQRGGTPLGLITVSGPFDMEKTEGKITVQVSNIDKNLLNLAGGGSGVDFGPTQVSSTNEITLSKAGAMITAAGRFNLNQFQVTRANETTPALDLHADYDVGVDRTASNAVLRSLTLSAAEKGSEIVHGDLTSPMGFNWGSANGAVGDSTLTLAVTRLNLADWKAFLGQVAPAGQVNGQLKLGSQQAGKQLTFDLNSGIDGLTVIAGSNQITQAKITFQMKGTATDFAKFNLPQIKFEVARQNETLVTLTGTATYDRSSTNADAQLEGQLMLASLLQSFPQPQMSVASGTAALTLHLSQQNQNQSVLGNFTLADFTGQFGDTKLDAFGTLADFDIGLTPGQIQIHKFGGKITQNRAVGGSFEVTGTCDLAKTNYQLTASLTGFNQTGIGPFLQAALGDKKLKSVAVNGNAAIQYDPKAPSSVKGGLQVTNLVVSDPSGRIPATPLEVRMQLDASLDKKLVTLRQFLLTLTPTSRAANQIQLSGQVDATQTNAIQGDLKLTADALDFTTYYDLFAGQQNAAAPSTPAARTRGGTATPAPASSTSEAAPQEPAAMPLPFHNFNFTANLGKIYLHDIAITDLQNSTRLDGGHIVLNPCKLTLNGALVTAPMDFDLSMPGWKYDISFNALGVPLAPLVDSFQPDRKGILSGTLTAQGKIAGAGVTPASLQKHLTGQFDFESTNLNLSIDNIQGKSVSTRLLKTLLSTIAVIPDLAKNPTSTATSLLSSLTGSSSSSTAGTGGLSADLKKSPIEAITMRGDIGSGRVNLQQANVQSPAFQAQVNAGTVTLADPLTNSPINLPVAIWLERATAQRINLAGDTPANATYARLPDFLTITGTLGASKSDINKVALATAVLKGVGGQAGQAGSALQQLDSVLGNKGSSSTPSGGNPNQSGTKSGGLLQNLEQAGRNALTNSASTNKSKGNNLLDRFLK